jgi:LmbE family N-acetylglucosaminyl deacetylase
MSIFISPHNDDETLFGAFTLLREKPLVVVVFDGYVQAQRGLPVTWKERRAETMAALIKLGCCGVVFLGLRDDHPVSEAVLCASLRLLVKEAGGTIYAPAFESGGHPQHNLVAAAVPDGPGVRRYLTYTTAGKSTSDKPVPVLNPDWIRLKLLALACYRSQFNTDPRMGCWPHFLRSQEEFYL